MKLLRMLATAGVLLLCRPHGDGVRDAARPAVAEGAAAPKRGQPGTRRPSGALSVARERENAVIRGSGGRRPPRYLPGHDDSAPGPADPSRRTPSPGRPSLALLRCPPAPPTSNRCPGLDTWRSAARQTMERECQITCDIL